MSAPPTEAPAGELALARRLAAGALTALEQASARIDDLNVYPVPDGDTGSNLLTTARAVAAALEAPLGGDRAEIARVASRAARMGARGSAGVILAQCLRGALEALPESGPIDAAALATMVERARTAARAAIRRPAAGTMLSLLDEMAEAAGSPAHAGESGPVLLASLLERAEQALERTREEPRALREASLVDAGAAGMVACLRGLHGSVATLPGDGAQP
jgi:dihydroxyacetone kinase-like predicted kinase